jgi:hypothetical protein
VGLLPSRSRPRQLHRQAGRCSLGGLPEYPLDDQRLKTRGIHMHEMNELNGQLVSKASFVVVIFICEVLFKPEICPLPNNGHDSLLHVSHVQLISMAYSCSIAALQIIM